MAVESARLMRWNQFLTVHSSPFLFILIYTNLPGPNSSTPHVRVRNHLYLLSIIMNSNTVRRAHREDMKKLAGEHLQHALQPSDCDALRSVVERISTHARIGSFLGLFLGGLIAHRLHARRLAKFNAFCAQSMPARLIFTDGRIGEWQRAVHEIFIFIS